MENTETREEKMPITYEDLKQALVDSGRPYDFDMIDRAYALAEKAHGGQRRLAHIVAHHDAVHRVVQLLEELPGHDGQGKEEQLPPGRAGGHIIFFGKRRFRHGKASFPEKQTRRRQIGMSRQAVFDLEYLFYSTDAVQLC